MLECLHNFHSNFISKIQVQVTWLTKLTYSKIKTWKRELTCHRFTLGLHLFVLFVRRSTNMTHFFAIFTLSCAGGTSSNTSFTTPSFWNDSMLQGLQSHDDYGVKCFIETNARTTLADDVILSQLTCHNFHYM